MNTNLKLNKKSDYKLKYKNDEKSVSDNKLINGTTIISQIKIDNDGNLLLLGYSNYSIKVSTSCLITPIDGDRVSAIVDGNNLYITSIIARQSKDLTINVENSDINIVAKNIDFKVNKNLSINSDKFTLFSNLTYWQAGISHYKYNKVYISSSTYFNNAENSSEIYAKNITFKAEQSYTLRSKISVLTSDAMLKLDGGQIHMG